MGISVHRTIRAAHARSAAFADSHRLDRWFATLLQRHIEPAAVALELWDGWSPYRASASPVGHLIVHNRTTLLRLLRNGDFWFGEAYTLGELTVRGALQPIVESLMRLTSPDTVSWRDRLTRLLERPASPTRSRSNVHHHYDLGNHFYARWLDEELLYTCAFFPSPDAPLEVAQRAKMDRVCRKLRLQPGEVVVEAGCGWGALALHMAREYGVTVKAFNISREQLAYARERAQREGLADRVEFIDDDYRNVNGSFDVFVSVGMLEHVGRPHFPTLAAVLRRCLHPHHGRGLLHFIGRDTPRPLNEWIRHRIFPGGYPPTLAEVATSVLSPAGLSVLDVENLRLHYAQTLSHWSSRFAAARDGVAQQYGEEFCRAWELYLAGSESAFATGWMQLFQVVFAPLAAPPRAWTRDAPFETALSS